METRSIVSGDDARRVYQSVVAMGVHRSSAATQVIQLLGQLSVLEQMGLDRRPNEGQTISWWARAPTPCAAVTLADHFQGSRIWIVITKGPQNELCRPD